MTKRIEQVWHPYWLWEDALMYHPADKDTRGEQVNHAIKLLSDPKHFEMVARWMILAFPYACEHNLTNPAMNKIAYIGQASCYYAYGVKEEETREAWRYLTEEQRERANQTAQRVLNDWESKYIKNHA